MYIVLQTSRIQVLFTLKMEKVDSQMRSPHKYRNLKDSQHCYIAIPELLFPKSQTRPNEFFWY